MNLFWLSMDLKQCARMHTAKHITKMPLETTQILSTAYWLNDTTGPYDPNHQHHPCTRWAAQTVENYRLTWKLGYELFKEFRYRRGKPHGSEPVFFSLRCAPPNLTARGFTKIPQAMPVEYHHHDVVTAYRDYYRGEKQHLFDWECRPIPDFVTDLCT